MRISTSEFFRLATAGIVEQQAALSRQQLKIASGREILTPSDDPVGAAQIISYDSAIDAIEQFNRNANRAEGRLGLTEESLAAAVDNLQRVRELTVAASNDTQTNESRSGIAKEIRQRLDDLVNLANTRDANGEFIFAGNLTSVRPFRVDTTAAAGVRYDGDDGQRLISIDTGRQVAINESGRRIFMASDEGNGTFVTARGGATSGAAYIGPGDVIDATLWVPDDYTLTFDASDPDAVTFSIADSNGDFLQGDGTFDTAQVDFAYDPGEAGQTITALPGIRFDISGDPDDGDTFTISPAGRQSVFETYNNLIATLEGDVLNASDGAEFREGVERVLQNLDQSLTTFIEARSDVGGRLRTVDDQEAVNTDRELQYEGARSRVEDLDYAEAISNLQFQITAFQAAQQSFIRIQGLSLFRLLG